MWLWIFYDCACYLMLEWEREIEKKEEKMINREDQISELTFNFHGALSTSAFLKWAPHIHQEKQKKKIKKKEKKKKKKDRGETRRKKKKKEKLCLSPYVRKINFVWPYKNLSFDTSLDKLMLRVLISKLLS